MAGMTFKIDVKELTEFRKDIAKAGSQAKPVFRKALDEAGMKVKADARSNITGRGTTFTGELQLSVTHKTSTTPLQVEIGTPKIYAPIIHDGKRGGKMPPPRALERWAAVKLGDPGLAFAVARKIKQRGGIVKKNPFLEDAFNANKGFAENRISQAVLVIVKMMAGK